MKSILEMTEQELRYEIKRLQSVNEVANKFQSLNERMHQNEEMITDLMEELKERGLTP